VIGDLVFAKPPIYIGSASDCGICLTDFRVHGRQALLSQAEEGSWRIEHLAGTSKTKLNGRQLTDSEPLSNGDQITIQDFTLNVYMDMNEEVEPVQSIEVNRPTFPLPAGATSRSKRKGVFLTPSKLDQFTDFSFELRTCTDIASVMECVLSALVGHLRARAAWIGVRRQPSGPLDYMHGRNFQGQIYDEPLLYECLTNRCLDRGQHVWVPQHATADVGSIIAAPLASPAGKYGLIYVDSQKGAPAFTEDDFDYVGALSTLIARGLRRVLREKDRLRQVISTEEESIVRAIQAKLDPQLVPEWPLLQVAVHFNPGQMRAGDIYDITQLPNGAAAFLVGHVSAQAAVTAIALTEVRTAFRIAVLHADMPHVMMGQLNWLLCRHTEAVSMQCAIVLIDSQNGALLHCIAGRSCAVIVGMSGKPRWLDSGGAPELGTVPGFEYGTRKGLMGKRESVAMFTPGIAKLKTSEGIKLDEETFVESLCDGFGVAARTALDETLADLALYLEGGNQPDDVTIMLAHRMGEDDDE